MTEDMGQEKNENKIKIKKEKYFYVAAVAFLMLFSAGFGLLYGLEMKTDFAQKEIQNQCNSFICKTYLNMDENCSGSNMPSFIDSDYIYKLKLNESKN